MTHPYFSNPQITDKVKDNLAYFVNTRYPHYFSAEDIEDLVQDSWIRLLTCKRGYESEVSQPQTVLTKIAKRLAIDVFKKRVSLKDVMSQHEEYSPMKDRRSYDPVHSDLEIKEQLDRVDSIISKMDPQTQVLVYGIAEGMSYKELESELGIKSGTLAVRMKRVREELTAKSCTNKKISSGHVCYSLPPIFGEDNYMCAA